MSALWQLLRGWFARVGSDPYYASYERSLGNIKAELDRLQVGAAAMAGTSVVVASSVAAAFSTLLLNQHCGMLCRVAHRTALFFRLPSNTPAAPPPCVPPSRAGIPRCARPRLGRGSLALLGRLCLRLRRPAGARSLRQPAASWQLHKPAARGACGPCVRGACGRLAGAPCPSLAASTAGQAGGGAGAAAGGEAAQAGACTGRPSLELSSRRLEGVGSPVLGGPAPLLRGELLLHEGMNDIPSPARAQAGIDEVLKKQKRGMSE